MSSLLFYPEIATPVTSALAIHAQPIDPALVSRIRGAYQLAIAKFDGHGESMWQGIFGQSSDVHDCLMTGSDAALVDLLADPGRTNLFYGFDSLVRGVDFDAGAMKFLPLYT